MAKKNFYAIKRGKNKTKNIIVDSWDECAKLVLGYNAIYKGFVTREEAEEFLNSNEDKGSSGEVSNKKLKELEKDMEMLKEQINKSNDKKNKKKRKSKNSVQFEINIPKDLYEVFINKCSELNMSESDVIKNMIQEWVI